MEIWKEIDGFNGLYAVSNTGKVKSLTRFKKWGRATVTLPEKLIKATYNPYPRVTLCKNGKLYGKLIHRLVACAYIENPNNYPIVMHLDDNPQNNCVNNLKWATHAMNSKDMANKGRARNQYTSII